MQVDRDLAVAALRAWWGPPDRNRCGWEVTPATGIRGLRLLVETGVFSSFLFTEPGDAAFDALARNVEGRPGANATHTDGRALPAQAPFDYVDVDPYGSPIPFLDTALRAVRPGGVLAVTATDMMVLAGAQPSATVRKYGARPVRGRLGPEGGLRILVGYLARRAREAGRSVRPRLAYVRAHYVRAYLEVGPEGGPADPVAVVDPAAWDGPPLEGLAPFGPLWLGPLIDPELLAATTVPTTAERPDELSRLLARLREDASVPVPFYYEPNRLASRLSLPFPPGIAPLLDELRRRGFRAVRTHARDEGIRTDAPREAVEEAARRLAGSGQSQNARVRA